MKKLFKKISEAVSVYDFLLVASAIEGFVVALPFVLRQFARLAGPEGTVKIGDVLWNAAFDLLVFNAAVLVLVLLMKGLRKLDRWLEKRS